MAGKQRVYRRQGDVRLRVALLKLLRALVGLPQCRRFMAPVTRQLADLTVPFLDHESDDEDGKDGDKDAKGKARGTREKKKEKKEKKKSRNGGEAAISVAASELCEVLIESVDADAVWTVLWAALPPAVAAFHAADAARERMADGASKLLVTTPLSCPQGRHAESQSDTGHAGRRGGGGAFLLQPPIRSKDQEILRLLQLAERQPATCHY